MSRPVANEFPASDPGALRLALVGESPGADECAMGRPFCGKSGWILNQWLAQAGVSRSQVFVGNVVQVRPSASSNEFHLFEWHEERVQAGIAALRDDLARFRPHCVVALGNAALHLLRHGNVAPPKSAKLRLFQWTSHIGTWRGSLFLASPTFDCFEAADLRMHEVTRYENLVATAERGEGSLKHSAHSSGTSVMGTPACNIGPLPNVVTPVYYKAIYENLGGTCTNPHGGIYDNASGKAAHLTEGRLALPSASLTAGAAQLRGPSACVTQNAGRAPEIQPALGTVGETPLNRSSYPVADPAAPFKTLGTYHPAATFRDPSFAFPLVSDLKRAVAEARSASLTLPPRNIRWNLAIDEVEARCAAIRAARSPVGFDIEGGLGGLQCCSFATSPSEAFVIDLMGECFERPRLMRAIASVLEDPEIPKVLWNAAYERAILHATASITLCGYEDGMLAWWERFSELPKGLDFVASILTREPYWAEGIGWDKRTGLPKVTGPRFLTYNGLDSCITLEIWQHPLIRAVTETRTPVPFAIA